jgi:hypothetical protein
MFTIQQDFTYSLEALNIILLCHLEDFILGHKIIKWRHETCPRHEGNHFGIWYKISHIIFIMLTTLTSMIICGNNNACRNCMANEWQLTSKWNNIYLNYICSGVKICSVP